MTTQEFSNEFDVLYNNIMSNQAPGLNEYEKSVFLTKAQYEIVKNYCNPKGNKYQEGVDGSPKRQIDFSTLLRVEAINPSDENALDLTKFDKRSKVFVYPSDAWISINESLEDSGREYQIIPLAYNDYTRLMSKPYKYPLKNQAWRLFNRVAEVKTSNYNTKTIYYNEIDNNITLSCLNNTDKDLIITLKESSKVNPESNPPIIKRNILFDEAVITLPVNISSSRWWQDYLINPKSPNYAKEFVDMTGPWDSLDGHSKFPNFIPNKGNIEDYTIMQLVIPAKKNINKATVCEIIGMFKGNNPIYKVRYFKKPTPIITYDLNTEDTPEESKVFIEKYDKAMDCILPDELHPEILQRAVELAKSAYQGDISSITQMGQRSE